MAKRENAINSIIRRMLEMPPNMGCLAYEVTLFEIDTGRNAVIERLTRPFVGNNRKHTKEARRFPFTSANDDSIQDDFLIDQRVAHP